LTRRSQTYCRTRSQRLPGLREGGRLRDKEKQPDGGEGPPQKRKAYDWTPSPRLDELIAEVLATATGIPVFK
jgi:hypothetical protein